MCWTHIRSYVPSAESKNENFQNFETVCYGYRNNGYTKTNETVREILGRVGRATRYAEISDGVHEERCVCARSEF